MRDNQVPLVEWSLLAHVAYNVAGLAAPPIPLGVDQIHRPSVMPTGDKGVADNAAELARDKHSHL
jgi:hypothetical protein